jgi:hypothetical protein
MQSHKTCRIIPTLALFAGMVLLISPARADGLGDFLTSVLGSQRVAAQTQREAPRYRHHKIIAPHSHIGAATNLIAMNVSQRLGAQWVPIALRIAHIESGGRCNARNGRALGVFQVINPGQFGVSKGQALTCEGGVRAGVAHMERCIRNGARTNAQMLACHNSGSPFTRTAHLEKAYRRVLARL